MNDGGGGGGGGGEGVNQPDVLFNLHLLRLNTVTHTGTLYTNTVNLHLRLASYAAATRASWMVCSSDALRLPFGRRAPPQPALVIGHDKKVVMLQTTTI